MRPVYQAVGFLNLGHRIIERGEVTCATDAEVREAGASLRELTPEQMEGFEAQHPGRLDQLRALMAPPMDRSMHGKGDVRRRNDGTSLTP